MAKAEEYRDKSHDELEAVLQDTQREFFELVNEANLSKEVSALNKKRGLKRDIARIKTVMREKELAEIAVEIRGEVA